MTQMDIWDEDTIRKISEWDPKGPPLVLIGPSGYGKTRGAESLLKDYNIIRYYPCDFRENKDFLLDIKAILAQRGVLAMMRAGPQRAILIENIGHTTASDKPVLQFLASQKSPSCPIIMTSEKTEKRHRDLLRNCVPVRIAKKDDAHDESGGANGEEISELAFRILKGETYEIPPSTSFTERVVLVTTLLENLGNRVSEWYHIVADKASRRIFDEERWDLIRVINEYVFPEIFSNIKEKPFTKKPFFTLTLSYNSTRALNRKAVMGLMKSNYDDPVVALKDLSKKELLPTRFRVKLTPP